MAKDKGRQMDSLPVGFHSLDISWEGWTCRNRGGW